MTTTRIDILGVQEKSRRTEFLRQGRATFLQDTRPLIVPT